MEEIIDLLQPLKNVKFVDRDKLRANDYNPNVVSEQNLELLVQSILTNGWTMPIVVRPDYTIIDGFHRWTVSGREPLNSKLGNKVPVVIVDHKDEAEDMYGTITHNRARGTHQLEPMKAIIKKLFNEGKTTKEIYKQLYNCLVAGDPKARTLRGIQMAIMTSNAKKLIKEGVLKE